MATVKQIYDFAIKWCDKFRDCDINYIELLDHWMADECIALGFNIDCGKAFKEKYGLAIYDPETLNKIIDDITDIPLLGSAIYLRWRYFIFLVSYVRGNVLVWWNRWSESTYF